MRGWVGARQQWARVRRPGLFFFIILNMLIDLVFLGTSILSFTHSPESCVCSVYGGRPQSLWQELNEQMRPLSTRLFFDPVCKERTMVLWKWGEWECGETEADSEDEAQCRGTGCWACLPGPGHHSITCDTNDLMDPCTFMLCCFHEAWFFSANGVPRDE